MKREQLFAILSLCVMIGCAVDPRDAPPGQPEEVSSTEQDLGGGGAPPGCADKAFCYCQCRVDHPCYLNDSQCAPLGTCLTACDHQYPTSCPDTGNQFPRTLRDCF